MRAVSLFSGCGGSDAGLHKLGVDIVMANDILSYAKDVYLANLPETNYVLDNIKNIKSFPNAELLIGCYPCQGFSQGGKRKADTSINYLYQEFDRALRCIKPKAFVVENVSGMMRANNKSLFRNQIIRFRLAGYKVKYKMLDARDYGLAQARKRVFLVGVRSDIDYEYCFPQPLYGDKSPTSVEYKTIKDVIGNMEPWPIGEFYDYDFHWYYLSRNRYRGWAEQSTTIVSNERHIGLHPSSPKLIKVEPDKWVFDSDAPARRFSYREAARLQGFDNLVFPDSGGRTKRFKVIGNAVPPPLFEEVCRSLIGNL